jgi:hypothetical protein
VTDVHGFRKQEMSTKIVVETGKDPSGEVTTPAGADGKVGRQLGGVIP